MNGIAAYALPIGCAYLYALGAAAFYLAFREDWGLRNATAFALAWPVTLPAGFAWCFLTWLSDWRDGL